MHFTCVLNILFRCWQTSLNVKIPTGFTGLLKWVKIHSHLTQGIRKLLFASVALLASNKTKHLVLLFQAIWSIEKNKDENTATVVEWAILPE